MIAITIFACTFVLVFALVFALGFQSLNVNNGHYKAAALTSFAIGASNLILFKTVPQADMLQIIAYLVAGPVAIVCSMYAHRRYMTQKPKQRGQVPPKAPAPDSREINPVNQPTPIRAIKISQWSKPKNES